MSGLWGKEIQLAGMPILREEDTAWPFGVPTVNLSVLERDWVVVPDRPFPDEAWEEILNKKIPPERALVALASRLPATLDLVRPVHQRMVLPAEEIDLTLPELRTQVGEVKEVVNPESVLQAWFDRLPLSRMDYNVGTVVEAGPVRAAEIFTKPLKVVSRDTDFDFGFAATEVWQGVNGEGVVFDPVWWQVDHPSPIFAAVNRICEQSVRLQVLAERVSRIVTALPRPMIEERMKAAGVHGSVIDYLVGEIVDKDPKRLAMRKLAMRAQLTAARMAILEGLRQNLQSNALFLIAFSAHQWTQGGLARLVDEADFREVLTKGPGSGGLSAELKEIEKRLEKVLSGETDGFIRSIIRSA